MKTTSPLRILKKPIFWLAILLLINITILLANFSQKIVYGVKYTSSNAVTIFDNKTKTAVQYDSSDHTKRMYYNYFIDGDNIYLYHQSSESYSYTYKLKIINKFQLADDGNGKIFATKAENTYTIMLSINGIIVATISIVLIERLRDYLKKHKTRQYNEGQQ